MIWIEITGKSGVRIELSHRPMWEIVDRVNGLGKITSFKITPNTIPNISEVRIGTEDFNCLLTCTTKQAKKLEEVFNNVE